MDPLAPPPGLLHGADHWADELDFENLMRLAADEPVPDTSSDNQTRSDAANS